MFSLSDQILTIAAVLEAIVLLPVLLEFLSERRKRKHTVDLSLEIVEVAGLNIQLAGIDDILVDISDLIDRARHPEAYAELRLGNEILIAGPPLSGKKTLAKRIACEASFDRIIIVHNPRNVDALARAKHLAQRARNQKIMLLLPRLDLINEREDEELLVELDALIEAISELSHALVVGTTNKLIAGSETDHLFGVTLTLPGAPVVPELTQPLQSDVHRMLAGIAEFYLARTLKSGYRLVDISSDGFIARILLNVTNPAQIEDIVVLCQTAAIYRCRTAAKEGSKGNAERVITPEMLELAMRRVVVGG
jgi:ATPase family associated with various cellular activities (AAA)